jgi:hypothetical protein
MQYWDARIAERVINLRIAAQAGDLCSIINHFHFIAIQPDCGSDPPDFMVAEVIQKVGLGGLLWLAASLRYKRANANCSNTFGRGNSKGNRKSEHHFRKQELRAVAGLESGSVDSDPLRSAPIRSDPLRSAMPDKTYFNADRNSVFQDRKIQSTSEKTQVKGMRDATSVIETVTGLLFG